LVEGALAREELPSRVIVFVVFSRPSQTWSSSPAVNRKPLLYPNSFTQSRNMTCSLFLAAFTSARILCGAWSPSRDEPSGPGQKHSVSQTSNLFGTRSRLVLQVSANSCSLKGIDHHSSLSCNLALGLPRGERFTYSRGTLACSQVQYRR
jgi:hypothetical protein